MKVIKVGGSLVKSGQLLDCLAHIAQARFINTVIVPGGGDFANQVRLAQQQWQFDDQTAHHMAILAMQQMAILFHALQPDWLLSNNLAELQQTKKVSIWLPEIALLNHYGIPANWAVTSDSLAAWLAGNLNTKELIIVKAAPCPNPTSLSSYVEQGILDAAFLTYSQPESYNISIINTHDFLDHYGNHSQLLSDQF